ncbi:hypothetical protein MPNT_10414 [Candidatus Methylacidithermus pantelleriae]|uniref:Uncharacterized protein n=1 Tax=Candidatus Methylacidithermus pantelleriae TaxID=2744239 RepID=A0A8J2BM22_9BACT|nr:hypothetical protein MPNT_10414 [Candidatus Methylacidithermus pantelleriae]
MASPKEVLARDSQNDHEKKPIRSNRGVRAVGPLSWLQAHTYFGVGGRPWWPLLVET